MKNFISLLFSISKKESTVDREICDVNDGKLLDTQNQDILLQWQEEFKKQSQVIYPKKKTEEIYNELTKKMKKNR